MKVVGWAIQLPYIQIKCIGCALKGTHKSCGNMLQFPRESDTLIHERQVGILSIDISLRGRDPFRTYVYCSRFL